MSSSNTFKMDLMVMRVASLSGAIVSPFSMVNVGVFIDLYLYRFFIAVMPVVNKYLYVGERERLLAHLFL